MSQSSVVTESAPAVQAPRAHRFAISSVLNIFGPFLILLFVAGLFFVIMPADVRGTFFGIYNLKLILTQTVIVAIGALGMTMIIVSGGIDLSVGSLIALTSVLGAALINQGYCVPSVVGICIASGGLVGLVNGAIIAGFR